MSTLAAQQFTESTLGGGFDPRSATSAQKPPAKIRPRRPKLKSEGHKATLRQLEEWYDTERIRQAPNRYQMAIDHDFYDGLQWADEDRAIVEERGQPALTYNKTQPAVKWVTGTEKRTRIDWKVLPRSQDDVDDAGIKTKLLKYVQDVNKSEYERSRAFEDAVKVGVGWLESGIRGDPTKELIYDRHESWRNIMYDSTGSAYDLSDSRYLFRHRWCDLDIAIAMFPEYEAELRAAAVSSDLVDAHDSDEWYLGETLSDRSADGSYLGRRTFVDSASGLFNRRSRVFLIECWYRRPTAVWYVDQPGGHFHGEEFDDADTQMAQLLASKAISVYQRLAMKMRTAVFVRGTLLQDQDSPYKHNDFPFTPIWANRRGRDNAPYGMIRVIRDPQEDFNKRMSKALHSLSTKGVVMDNGAVEDIEDLREEIARPDFIISKKAGKDNFVIVRDTENAEHHVKYAEIDARMIQDLSGVTDELLGKRTNATSGKAIDLRQDQGSTVTTDFFDNYRLGVQLHGQKQLSLVRQFYVEPKVVRITGSRRTDTFIQINQPAIDPDTGQSTILNDVTKNEADFIVSETDYRASVRQAMADSLTQLVAKLPPDAAMMLLDNVVEMYDIPGVEELVQTIRKMTGKPDPDQKLTPEQEAELAQRAATAQQQKDAMAMLAVQEAAAGVDKLVAQAEELRAKAEAARAKAATEGGDGGKLALSMAEKYHRLERATDQAIFKLRAELLRANGMFQNQRANDHARIAVAQINAGATLDKAQMDNETKLIIAAVNDQAEQYRQGIAREMGELDDGLKALTKDTTEGLRLKVDKPTPQQEAKELIAEHTDRIKADRKEEKAKATQQKTDQRIKGVEKAVKDNNGDAGFEIERDDKGRVVGMKVKHKAGNKQVSFQTDAKGRITGARVH